LSAANRRVAVSLMLQDKPHETAVASDSPQVNGVAGRYATALFALAREAGTIDAVHTSLSEFQAVLHASDDLRALLKSAVFSARTQTNTLNALFKLMELDAITQNVLLLLAENRRLSVIEDIIKGYGALVASHRGEVAAQIISALPLTPEQMESLTATLQSQLGKSPIIEASVDPSILGGMIVKVGSRMIDTSLKTKLNSLKLLMKEVA
jgi:F-type H+-transporting ATPase subunit delta